MPAGSETARRVRRRARTVPLPAHEDRSSPTAASTEGVPDGDQVHTSLIKPGHPFDAPFDRRRGRRPSPAGVNAYSRKSKPRLIRPMNVLSGCCSTSGSSASGHPTRHRWANSPGGVRTARHTPAGFWGHHTDLQHSDTLLHSTAGYERRPCQSRTTDAGSSGQITRAIRGKMRSFNRTRTNRTLQSERATEFSILQSVPKVGLEPTPSCEDRILSPARLPSV